MHFRLFWCELPSFWYCHRDVWHLLNIMELVCTQLVGFKVPKTTLLWACRNFFLSTELHHADGSLHLLMVERLTLVTSQGGDVNSVLLGWRKQFLREGAHNKVYGSSWVTMTGFLEREVSLFWFYQVYILCHLVTLYFEKKADISKTWKFSPK